MENFFADTVAEPKNFFADTLEPPKPDQGDLGRGFKESFQQLPQMGYGLVAGVGAAAESAFGEGGIATGIKKAGVKGYQEAGDKIAQNAKPSDSWDYSYNQAKDGNFGALVDWLQHGIGYVGGQGIQTLATGGLGAVGGKFVARTAAKQIAEGMVAKEAATIAASDAGRTLAADQISKMATANVATKFATIGQTAAVGANAFGMEGGEIFGDLTSTNKDRALTGSEIGKAFVATLGAGALEFVGDKVGLDIMLGKSKLLKPTEAMAGLKGRAARGAVAAVGAAPIEAGTEYAQTLAEEYGKGNDPFSAASLAQARDAAALGALGGTVIGGAGGAMHGAKAPAQQSPKADPIQSVIGAGSIDEAIAAATNAVSETGTAWQSLGVTPSGPTSNTLAKQIGQAWQALAPEQSGSLEAQRAAIEQEGAARSKARDAAITNAGQQWQELGITNPQDDLQAQKMGMRGEQTAMQLAMQRAQEKAANGPTDGVLPVSEPGRGNEGSIPAGGMELRAADAQRLGADQTGRVADSVGQPGEYASAVPERAVDQRLIPLSKRNEQNTAPRTNSTETQAAPTEARTDGASQLATAADLPGAGSAAVQPAGVTPSKQQQGEEVSRYSGKFGKGMGKDAARLEASRLNRVNTNKIVNYAAEEHNDPKMENPYVVVGRQVSEQKQPLALAESAPVATEKIAPKKAARPQGGKTLRATAYDRNPLLTFLATHGLYHDKTKPNSHKSEFSPDKGIMVMGYGPVFKKTGKRLDELTQNAIEEGYLPKDGTESQLRELVRRAVAGEKISPMYAEGVAEQLAEQSYAEHLAQQQEAAKDEDFDPAESLDAMDFVLDDSDWAGYDDLPDPIKLEVNALLAKAQDAGIDTATIEEDAHYATIDQSEQAYYESARSKLQAAIEAGDQGGRQDAGTQGNAGSQEGLTLTAPSRQEVLAQQAALEAEAKRKEDGGDKPAPRKQLTGDVPDMFNPQGSVFDQPADPTPEVKPADPAAQATAILDAAEVTGKERVDVLKDVKKGDITPDELKAAYPAKAPIGDFGQKIGGAKKDTWTGFKDDLSAIKDEDIASSNLSEVWPAPNYQKMIDDGMDAKSVAVIRALRDEIPAKPRNSYKLKRWADQVQTMRALATNILNGKDTGASIAGFLERGTGPSKGIAGRADLYVAVGHDKSLEGIRLAHHHYSLYRGRENVSLWVAERDAAATAFRNFPQELATGDTKEQAIEAFKEKYDSLDATAAVKKAEFVIFTKGDGDKGFYIGKKIGRNIADMGGPFDSLKDARAYREKNLPELEAKLAKYKEIPKERRDTNEPRVGEDMRNGQDVTPEMFSDAFGFKGVEFGNYVEQKRRQKDLNDSFDALMDMAAIMGVPAKAISLNGELGLAFGARGSGGVNPAAAHYESDKIVINLTKKEGAGSLGHEWWHALDNYFSRMRGSRTSPFMTTATDVGLSARGSNYMPYEGVRKEMIDAFGEVVRSIKNTAIKARSSKMDAKRTKEYWTTGEEMAARAFESYLISKLHDQNASNDYLANVVDQKTWDAMAALGMENEDSYPYPTAGEMPVIRAGFDKFFQTLETKETDKGVAMFSREGQRETVAPVSRSPAKTPLYEAMRQLSRFDDAFQTADSGAKDLPTIAKEMTSKEGFETAQFRVEKSSELHQGNRKPTLALKVTLENGNEVKLLDIFDADKDRPFVVIGNSEAGQKAGGATAYQIAFAWAHNNGKTMKPDPAGLTVINRLRRTEAMISSAMHFGTTKHLEPHQDQYVALLDRMRNGGKEPEDTHYSSRPDIYAELEALKEKLWTSGDSPDNIASNVNHLLEASAQLAYSREPAIRNFEVVGGKLRVRDGREGALSLANIDVAEAAGSAKILGVVLRPATSGVGASTLRRAAVSGSIARANQRAQSADNIERQNSRNQSPDVAALQAIRHVLGKLDLSVPEVGKGVFYSEGKPAVRNPSTVEAVQAAVSELIGSKQLPNRLGRIVATTAAEIKSRWEPLIDKSVNIGSEGEAGVAQAFYDPPTKTVFLIADHISKGNEMAVAAHELMHKHGQAVLGEDGWNRMHSAIGEWENAEPGSQENAVYQYARSKVEAVGLELSNQELFPYAVEAAFKMGIKPSMAAKKGSVARWLESVRQNMKMVWDTITGKPELFKTQDLVDLAFGIAQRENHDHAMGDFRGTTESVTKSKDVVGNQGGRSADDTTPGAAKPLTEKQFYSQYAQHIDLRGRDGTSGAAKESILRDGFKKGVNVNAMPPYRGGKPANVMDAKFAPRKGDTVYLAPKTAWKDKPNGMEIQDGWVPKQYEVIVASEDHPSMYQEYLRAFNESTAPDSGGAMFSRTNIVGKTNRQHTPEQLRAMKNVGFQTEEVTLKERAQALWKDAGKKLAQGIVDQFAPVKDLDKNAYAMLRLAKGASGAFEAFLQGGKLKLTDGVYDFDDTNKGGVIDKLLIPLQGEHHDFMRWVAANRAERLAGEGKENLFSAQDIADLKTLANGTTDFDYTVQTGPAKGRVTRDRTLIYADSNRVFNEFNRNVLDMAEQSGLIDGASRKVWEHEFYVPFYRVADEDGGGVRGMSVKGSVLRQQAFKELKGGKNALNADLLDNTLMNWAHLLDAAAKNRAAKATIDAAERMGIATGGNQSTLASMGASVHNKNGVVWFMDGGQKRYSLIDNTGDGPYLMTAINSLEYAGMRNPVMNAMGAMKHALTVGVTASPFFKVRNLIRDSVQAIGTGNLSYNPAANIAQGWKLTDPKSDAYFRLLAGGGTIHFGTMLEGSEAKRVQSLVEAGVDDATILNSDKKVKAFYRKFIEPGVTAYNELGNRGEAINRAALYDQLRKQGLNHADASLQARDLMDFSMQGSFTSIRFLTQVVPFFNARIQGLYKLGKSAKEDPARFGAVLGAAAMMSIGLLAAYGDDDDWKKREEWDRNNFWWFKFGGTAFRIPKPFEIGAIATLAERGFELAFDKEMTNKRFMGQVMTLLGDNLSMNPVPQLVKPMLDVYANKDSFSGRPIETMGMDKLKSEYRFTDRTSMLARGLSTAANSVTGLAGVESLSPVQIDSMLRGYFGWLGSFVVGAGDVIARPATGQAEHPSSDIWKAATGSMVSDLRDAPSRYVSQMYTQAKEIEQAYGTWRALLKEGKTQEAAEFYQSNRADLSKYRNVEAVKRAEAKFNERVRMIERSNMQPDEKRELIRSIQVQKNRVAQLVT